jgi:predicted HicB family RNase H-like nuclease
MPSLPGFNARGSTCEISMATKIDAAAEALKRARQADKTTTTWTEFHNAVFGIGGLFVGLFPTQADRVAFSKTDEYKQVLAMLEAKQDEGDAAIADASGKILARLPVSIHRALIAEAEVEGVSMNQLILAKLAVQLRAVVGV